MKAALRRRRLTELVELGAAMLDAARDGRWSEVAEGEAARQALIRELFASAAGAEEGEGLARGIRRVLDMDREIMALGRSTMDDLAARLGDLRQGQHAHRAYRRCAAGAAPDPTVSGLR